MTPLPATVLIAEDEPLLADALAADLAGLWPELRLVARVGDGVSALREALAQAPQVCLLDIRMPGLTGLQVAEALAEDWPEGPGAPPFPLLVFITAYDQYAVQAFERQAVDYLLKPVEPARLAAAVERLQRQLAARRTAAAADPTQALQAAIAQLQGLVGAAPAAAGGANAAAPRLEVIQAAVGSTVHLVPVDEVLFFEAADKYVRVVTAAREHLIRVPLKELLPQLDPQRFWQVHRGLIVQARAIERAERLDTGKVLLTLRGVSERLTASRLYAHLFRGM